MDADNLHRMARRYDYNLVDTKSHLHNNGKHYNTHTYHAPDKKSSIYIDSINAPGDSKRHGTDASYSFADGHGMKNGKGSTALKKHILGHRKMNESDGELPDAGTSPFVDTMAMDGPSASPAVTETDFADLHPEPDQWTQIPVGMLKHAEHEPPVNIDDQLYNILAKSYAYVGGHVDFKKPSDLPANHTIWYAVDTNYDKKPDAVKFGKTSPFGIKWTGGGSTGAPEAKQQYVNAVVNSLRTPGNYGEVSDAIAHILITRHNIQCVDNQHDVEKVIGKTVKWIGPHPGGQYPGYKGFYERELGGETHLKILLGKPFGIHSENVSREFIGVQPMNGPTGQMFAFKAFLEAQLDTDTEHDAVPSFEVLEDEDDQDLLPHALVPFAGVTDHLFSEDEDEVVPSDIAVDGRMYTEALTRGRKK